ncbi:MAG TPA: hypothetical protein VGU66_06630 [Candidatus Elarobacter sp.]|nr:hypothetical protein [Candidatus Elarobacter sp.]
MLSLQRWICAFLAVAIVVAATRFDGVAKPNGNTWTSEIAAGAALLYYLAKLGIDNKKADTTGRAADGVIDWKPLPPELVNATPAATPTPTAPPGANSQAAAQKPCPPMSPMPPPPDSMRTVRARLANDIAKLSSRPTCGGKIFADARKRYENLRGCWNAFIFAQPTPTPAASNPKQPPQSGAPGGTSGSSMAREPNAVAMVRFAAFAEPTLPPGGFRLPPASPAPASSGTPSTTPGTNPPSGQTGPQSGQAPPKKDPCTGDFAVVDQAYALMPGFKKTSGEDVKARDERIDLTDLADAISAPPLSQQILDLRVGSHVDDDALRAHLLYVLARALDDSILGRPPPFPVAASFTAAGSGSIDLNSLANSCVLNLAAKDCIAALGTAEATAAADRRRDVSCDVARRSWLPTFTAILRTRKDAKVGPLQDLDVDKNPWFGAVPGC